MDADWLREEVSYHGHCYSGYLQLLWLGHQIHATVWGPIRRMDSICHERRQHGKTNNFDLFWPWTWLIQLEFIIHIGFWCRISCRLEMRFICSMVCNIHRAFNIRFLCLSDVAWQLELLPGEEERLSLCVHCQTSAHLSHGLEYWERRQDRPSRRVLRLSLR